MKRGNYFETPRPERTWREKLQRRVRLLFHLKMQGDGIGDPPRNRGRIARRRFLLGIPRAWEPLLAWVSLIWPRLEPRLVSCLRVHRLARIAVDVYVLVRVDVLLVYTNTSVRARASELATRFITVAGVQAHVCKRGPCTWTGSMCGRNKNTRQKCARIKRRMYRVIGK